MVKRRAATTTVKVSSASSGTMPKVLVDKLIRWMSALHTPDRSPFFVVPGGRSLQGLSQYITWSQMNPGSINDVFGRTEDWVQNGVLSNLVERVRFAQYTPLVPMPIWFPPEPEVWELLWGMISGPEFIVEEPLRTIVDQQSYLAHDFYRLLWEVRFLVKENLNLKKAQNLVTNITRWAFGMDPEESFFSTYQVVRKKIEPAQVYDLLWMFLTLAHQNGLFTRYIFGMDGMEEALRHHPEAIQDFEGLIWSLERWVRLGGCPVGVLVQNFDASHENIETLRGVCPHLADRLIPI